MEQLRPTSPALQRALAHARLLSACRHLFAEEGDGLITALEHVAGGQGARRALRLFGDLDTANTWQRGFTHRLEQLRDLLLLEHLCDDWPEIAPDPAGLDPTSDLAHTCYRYADRIEGLVTAAQALDAEVRPAA